MHRTIEISLPPEFTADLTQKLKSIEHVIGLSVHYSASVKPSGDILTVHVLNRGADQVLALVQALDKTDRISVITAEVASMNDAGHQKKIDNDVDEAIWEEMKTGLRHQGRISANFITLMALGGIIAAAGLVSSDPVNQSMAFIASAIIAPGYEPLAKIPLSLVIRSWKTLKIGLQSALVAYIIIMVSAAFAFFLILSSGATTIEDFVKNPAVSHIATPTLTEILISVCGAVAGAVMIAAYRRNVIAGPLIALILIPAAAMTGMAAIAGRTDLMYQGLERLGLDIVLIITLGVIVFYIKQKTVHHRPPMQ